ncbi:MAG TPA: SDR family NAD(P)-dependent oxidoreductase [Marmoricola sp.]|nr:SDR family NAD(P)-dependent oxidoreductase [Nocardioidaceae bacterium]MCO5324046.1 SDR family NAD(P)-dependent oxidoreductase [Nocardioidaceae bacterium]HRV70156.1 SDR family NAD(P)-dependent oxidoreductase [Marmoricola sp.]
MTDLAHYGPWAVIAGGSEGVGAEFALQLAQAGVNLVLIARKPGPLEETAQQARAKGVEVRTLAVDLTSAQSISVITEATSDLEVGLLIYNAGANSYGHAFTEGDLSGFLGVLDLNVNAMLALTHHFALPMKQRRRGGILLVGSLAGYVGTATEAIYGGAKAFGRIFAEGLWSELRDYDVHVLELVLGVTRTPAMERAGLRFDVPSLTVGEPAEVAREGLAALPDGPVHVISGNEPIVKMRATSERAKLVLGTERAIKALLP